MLCILFAVSVLALTTLWVYVGRNYSFTTLANAMYFPAILCLLFVDNLKTFLWQLLGIQQVSLCILYSVFAILIVYIIVYLCLALDVSLGWATKVPVKGDEAIHGHNKFALVGFVRAAGEEIGWRCFLLPCLMSSFSPEISLFISGIVWGLFHVPVMVLLTHKLKPDKPYITIAVQFTSCALMAFPIGWIAIKSGYCLWSATFMHWWWNRLNPKVLGSIYTNTPGEYEGKQWMINGEGLAGCIVMFPIVFTVFYGSWLY